MGLIEFADNDGVRWRVWQVDTPPSRAHLMDPQFRKGWLVFEREDGTDRRRLSQVPDDWTALPRERLALLCSMAAPVVAGRSTSTGQQAAWPRDDASAK